MKGRPSPIEAIGDGIVSNGRYTVWMTPEGTGASFWECYALTPWTMAPRPRTAGILLHIRDRETGRFWTLGQPHTDGGRSERSAQRSPGRYRIHHTTDRLTAALTTCVHPRLDAEIRSLEIRNDAGSSRTIEITSYAEIALNRPAAHRAHPVFSKLFIETDAGPGGTALLAHRRARGADESHPWLVHAVSGAPPAEFETDRTRFIGRRGASAIPAALASGDPLSGSTGPVLDPIFSLRRILTLAPGEAARITFLLGVGKSRDEALALALEIDGEARIDGVFEAAAEAEVTRAGAGEIDRHLALAGAILSGARGLRAQPEILESASGDLRELGRLGIDFQRPLAVIETGSLSGPGALAEWERCIETWRAMAVPVEVVVLAHNMNHLPASMRPSAPGYRVLDAAGVARPTRALLFASARLVATGPPPALDSLRIVLPGDREADRAWPAGLEGAPQQPPAPVEFDNGYGGFVPGGKAYRIRIDPTGAAAFPSTPHPWVNAISNERAGILVSERGSCTTWSRNSREFRLTPWSNDPLLDPHGEAFFIRDDDTGDFWSAWPGPRPAPALYEVEHRFGSSECRCVHADLETSTTIFLAAEDPIQIVRLRVANRSMRIRRVTLFGYRRLVLGDFPEGSGRLVVTSHDAEAGAILARNRTAGEHAEAIVFAALSTPGISMATDFTTDAAEFLGPHGDLARPAAISGEGGMSRLTGAGLDACVAQSVSFRIEPGETIEVGFLFGETGDESEIRASLERYRRPAALETALDAATQRWTDLLSRLQISTPDPALDLLVNGWLPYQNLSCRILGRTAFYQSGGAYGFRDQLQDASAFTGSDPGLLRRQILLHAAHQFVEGDVLHWWHPPAGRGIRTRFADDLLWLPFIAAYYIDATGDHALLDESVRFLDAPPLAEGEDEVFLLPRESGAGTLYEHCCRAIDRSLGTGVHGLPLFGTGDWNDGMNRVGREGRGESVWMGFFLYKVLGDFLELCAGRGDAGRAARYRAARERLAIALNDAGWDGEWYRRGFYDSGEPLGSKRSDECKIDALVQAWSVISGAAPRDRAEQALDAVERHLISERDGIIRLLDPPFSDTPNDPGYIKGYLPGVRENGGQYTHAALWVIRALAELGRTDRVAGLLAMLSPIHHTSTREKADHYLLEPYVVAADVYSSAPHVGRGGWSWYTGSAGWMYRVAVESLLGLRWRGGTHLELSPCIPDDWPGFRVTYRPPDRRPRFEIEVKNPRGRARAVVAVSIDGSPGTIEGGCARIPLDLSTEAVRVTIVLG